MEKIETEVILIAGIGKNRELGIGANLVWRLPGDLRHFKEVTTGHPIIMGRKTYESIGKPLPKRINIVVTRDHSYRAEGVVVVHSLEQALEAARGVGAEKILIIGGGEMYRQALPLATHLNLTFIDAEEPTADIFFPEYEKAFRETSRSEPQEENGVCYTWVTFERK